MQANKIVLLRFLVKNEKTHKSWERQLIIEAIIVAVCSCKVATFLQDWKE